MKIESIRIPHMGAHYIGRELELAASQSEHPIVEVGAWLGAGTYHLARGAERGHRVPIYVYDRFLINTSEVRKARDQGYDLQVGQNTKDIVQQNVGYRNLHLNRTWIKDLKWVARPIGVYVDDAGKDEPNFKHKISEFEDWFIPGKTLCFFMDIQFCRDSLKKVHKYQWNYITRSRKYREIKMFKKAKAGGLFLYNG